MRNNGTFVFPGREYEKWLGGEILKEEF